jgi:sugar phosphate isomerase/epimerase
VGFDVAEIGMCPGPLAGTGARDAAQVRSVLEATAAAGFTSVAFATRWADFLGVDELVALTSDLGLDVRGLEAVLHWESGPEAAAAEMREHLDVAAALGATFVQAVLLTPPLPPMAQVAESFAALCQEASAFGVSVPIEFVPWTAIPDLATGWEIVETSGAPNGGICLDMLHWHRQPGGPNLDLLARIPGERIQYVQVADAPATVPDGRDGYLAMAMSERPVPGTGEVDIAAVLGALDAIGATPFVAFEVFNTELARQGAGVMAARLKDSAEALFGG